MALFDNSFVVLELKNLPYKEKMKLKLAIIENGGIISYVVNKQCTLVVTTSVSCLSSSRVRSVEKYQTPVVGVEYVSRCLEEGVLLPVEEYCLDPIPSPFIPRPFSPQSVLTVTSHSAAEQRSEVQTLTQVDRAGNQKRTGTYLNKFRVYTENDQDIPIYPANFHVAKYSIFQKANCNTWSVVELQSSRSEAGQQQYRVVRYWREEHAAQSTAVQDKQVFPSTSEEAVEVFQSVCQELQVKGLTQSTTLPPGALDLGSANLHQLLLEEKLSCSSVSQEVGVFVELLWAEALGCLDNVLKVPITSLSLNDVSRAEGLLLQVQKSLKRRRGGEPDTEVASLMEEIYTLLPHKTDLSRPPVQTKLISSLLDLCQLITDVLNVSEAMLRSPTSSCLGKYRALRCSIERVPPGPEFLSVTKLLQDRPVQIMQVLKVTRGVELQMFREELGNVKPLLHSSSPSSFVGILSRGLLLPRVGVEHHGIERTDIGNLGGGIYFSDAMSTSLKYSKPSETDGSRLLLVCDVALGSCKDLQKRDSSLTQAPDGYHSVHGVRQTSSTASEFEDDEYVVYSQEQVRLHYVVQFRLEDDQLKDFLPNIDTSSTELPLSVSSSDLLSGGEEEEGVGSSKNPLEEVTAGLLDSSGQPLPLQAVHVRARLMDLLSQVIVFQTYTNQSTVPIEAKYVFPLDDSAAVCGFEAFINGKHVVGQVKEKQQARKEYKQAIEKGHGAYLMDQDAPDVFTISVGNLPAGATVLIKVTYITELVVTDGTISFSLPGSVAPWQQSSALNQRTQVTLEKVCVTNLDSRGEFSLAVSIEMPNEIINLHCVGHKVMIKRTDCKAVVKTCPGESLGPDGFLLCFGLAQIHLPRMWVEKHPDKDSQACMLVFYPDFEPSSSSGSSEVILLVDSSESMRGEALRNARRIALQLLNNLEKHSVQVNTIFFGTDQKEAFISAQPVVTAQQITKKFIMSSLPVGGSTELWRPLRSLSLLPPSQGVRNLLLLSDGHVQNQALTLQLVREHAQHSRLFTCGLSPTANQHMLRALAQAGGGTYEFFDTKTMHTWREKVASQVKHMMSPGCSSVSVKWQQFNPRAPPPVQAPSQLHALFSDHQTLVYGFVPHCTQATLLGDVNGQDIETMVSTTELQKTRGTFLHKLTARAVIRDYEDGCLHINQAEHEGKKAELKSFIIELSKEFSILSQFTSFVAIEERDSEQPDVGFTDIPKLISDEDVDFLPYLSWKDGVHEEGVDEEGVDEEGVDEEGVHEEGVVEEVYKGICKFKGGEEVLDMRSCYYACEEEEDYEESGTRGLMESVGPSFGSSEELCDYSPPRDCDITTMEDSSSYSSDSDPPPTASPHRQPQSMLGDAFPSRLHRQSQSMLRGAFLCASGPPFPSSPQPQSIILDSSPPRASKHCKSPRLLLASDPPSPFKLGHRSFFVAPSPPPPPQPIPPSIDYNILCDAVPFSSMPSRQSQSASVADVLPLSFMPSLQSQSASVADVLPLSFMPSLQSQSASVADVLPLSFMPSRQSQSASVADVLPPPTSVNGSLSLHLMERYRSSVLTLPSPTAAWSEPLGRAMSQLPEPIQCDLPKAMGLNYSPSPVHPLPDLSGTGPAGDGEWPSPLVGRTLRKKSKMAAMSYRPPQGTLFGSRSTSSMTTGTFFGSPALTKAVISTQLPEAASKFRQWTGAFHTTLYVVKWPEIFALQHSEGYWECSASLGSLIGVDLDYFANVVLKEKGIGSLGVRAHADILRLVASLLVLQLMRVRGHEVGKLLLSLFRVDLDHSPPQSRNDHWEAVKRAVDWVRWADREYPCVCSRMEFGWDWESSTRQLLGIDPPNPLISWGVKAQ
ncbi:protein mono-ADP-ribosyltransferase PARP4 isoform X3 [Esox lucius]|uniref:protein mono-ADP-ribosyltransferase PARP4 isoform X2 n=1 Tax=Esox lucius TaxID=8010 RepID=UPI0014773EB2|nr:protein mono-ADP-ribosyltransferase PARP4 isoform X2 [Esox lucius]XP_034142722.1 protein mono-ADP-ribosyltransferase PARP4 isoform X3 [Esox lucius]